MPLTGSAPAYTGGEHDKRKNCRDEHLISQSAAAAIRLKLELMPKERIINQPMRYDIIDTSSSRKEFEMYEDYTRYRTLELVADEIRRKYTPEDLSGFCVAEAGVWKGDFA